MSTAEADHRARAAAHDRRRSAAACRPSSRTSRSRRSATSRTRACSRRGGRRAATGSSARTTSSGCETILRLQRDEFLPLRVIRQELASPSGAGKERRRRRAVGLADPEDELDLGELCERAAITPELARELEEFGLLAAAPRGRRASATRRGDVEIAVACAKLARFGIAPRHLRTFRTAADREAGLLEQLVAPALRSRNAERREAAVERAADPRGARAGALAAALLARPAARRRATDGGRRPEGEDPRRPGLPGARDRLQGHHAAARRPGGAARDGRASWRSGSSRASPTSILGAEARGFILGAALAYELGCGFVAARRPGKLPWKTVSATYALEYGENSLELHADAIADGAARARPRRRARDRRHRARRSATSSSSSAARSSASRS